MHEKLIGWFVENHRSLPWRASYDPYHVWISEVMLQQTQVETVVPYFERWMAVLPNVTALAAADEQGVLSLWAGLGYYSRARNLMEAARILVRDHGGRVPADYEALRLLPGIGQYTAGAIMSIAFNRTYPVVDGNVRRVLSRIYGWEDDVSKRLWEAAEKLVQRAEPRAINQAMMELGATVCSFRSPRCLVCPVQEECAAYKTGKQLVIPPVKKRPETVRMQLFAVVQEKSGRHLMKPSRGLWEFPMFSKLPAGTLQHVGSCRHTITHHRLEVHVYSGVLENTLDFQWQEFGAVPVSSLTRKIRAASD
ncbi:MAG TPA: A/G-specific adenine glycosylase [Terriglobia bacterium]|nr:A/G-specific adenine glycosylase [Terriglobia bacterium]